MSLLPLIAAAASAEPLPVDAQARSFTSERLPNGLQVSLLADPELPLVATQIWVQIGSAHEAEAELGFAHLFEHLMFGATANHGKDEYVRHHTANGGYSNAFTSFDNTVYVSTIPPAAFPRVLELEADRFQNLVLDQANLDNEIKIVTEELRLGTENDPFGRLFVPALAAVFGDHPYGHSPVGTKEDLAGADLALVQKFYAGYYRPANLHLVVVGPVDPDATMALIRERFGQVTGTAVAPPEVPEIHDLLRPQRVALTEDLPPIKVAARVYLGPSHRDPDWYPFHVMTEMLAGGELDRFREDLVTDRSKALEAGTLVETVRGGSLLAFGSISLFLRRTERAFALVEETLARLDEGEWLMQNNLDTTRRRLLRAEMQRSYHAQSLADAIGRAWAWQGDGRLALGGSVEALNAVTLEQVRASWKRWVVDARPTELYVHRGRVQEVQQ